MTAAVETLRQAAALIRARAQAATPGPWEAFRGYVAGPVGKCTCGGPFPNGGGHEPSCGQEPFAQTDPPTAEHIASWHPVVALAVADWLDHTAGLIEADGGIEGTQSSVMAIIAARAYLDAEP